MEESVEKCLVNCLCPTAEISQNSLRSQQPPTGERCAGWKARVSHQQKLDLLTVPQTPRLESL